MDQIQKKPYFRPFFGQKYFFQKIPLCLAQDHMGP